MEIISSTQAIINQAKTKLASLCPKETTLIVSNIHLSLMKQLVADIQSFNTYYVEFRFYTDYRLTREIKIAKPFATDEEIDAMKTNIRTECLFPQSEEHNKAIERFCYYKELYKGVMALDKQILGHNQLFVDISILIDQDLTNQMSKNNLPPPVEASAALRTSRPPRSPLWESDAAAPVTNGCNERVEQTVVKFCVCAIL